MEQRIVNDSATWHAPHFVVLERDGLHVLLDPEAPNWIATDRRGAWILSLLGGGARFGGLVSRYAEEFGVETSAAWLHVDRFLREVARRGFASTEAFQSSYYPGRLKFLSPRLRELWIHTNNSCNLACEHCLVSSGPREDTGMPADHLLALIDEGARLGVERFYFTGGEPFYRKGIFEAIARVTEHHGRDLTILTNGILFSGAILSEIRQCNRRRLGLQVSLDGAIAATNDAVRGAGTFERILSGIRNLVVAGLPPTIGTVMTPANVVEMTSMVRLLRDLGCTTWHLLWIHRKGRWAELDGKFVAPEAIHAALREAQAEAARCGVTIDNIEAFRQRVNGPAGCKTDLSMAGYGSLCVYSDGRVFPSAATVQYAPLALGRWGEQGLGEILETSSVAAALRALTVAEKPICRDCPYRFLCGGGDIEHSYSYSLGNPVHAGEERDRAAPAAHEIAPKAAVPGADGRASFLHLDPYCELYKGLIADLLLDLAAEGRRTHRTETGYGAPVIYHAMGEGSYVCAPGGSAEAYAPVKTAHSQCVLSVDIEAPRSLVEEFYAKVAETPQEALCCPASYDPADTDHIPREVLDRFYGCGGPMSLAAVRPGETVVDLGSGAGIDVFIAAKKIGPTGRAIGIDMTEAMLAVANQSRALVAANLGYDVVDFRKGYLEEIPLPDRSAHCITSNCVINLSLDKRRVFAEMWRVLRDHGRIVVSDIVADREVPPDLKVNVHLWGECIAGALSEGEFLAQLERAGFYGLCTLKKESWKEVEGYRFLSITVRGYKFHKTAGCVFKGHRAVYLGPYASVMDEEGHHFPRGLAVEVCTDTVSKLSNDPYRGFFAILEPGRDIPDAVSCCAPGQPCC